ncbi:hypothetical protein TWF481_002729 [Arthrobotrys musiformis]|uniref:Uncharacterized protein n=1 Tax=Arthrobotrys musiformis TaxID=47236 RepID=A0AAV9VTI3_9PEZI
MYTVSEPPALGWDFDTHDSDYDVEVVDIDVMSGGGGNTLGHDSYANTRNHQYRGNHTSSADERRAAPPPAPPTRKTPAPPATNIKRSASARTRSDIHWMREKQPVTALDQVMRAVGDPRGPSEAEALGQHSPGRTARHGAKLGSPPPSEA